jgi:hypothetical protein
VRKNLSLFPYLASLLNANRHSGRTDDRLDRPVFDVIAIPEILELGRLALMDGCASRFDLATARCGNTQQINLKLTFLMFINFYYIFFSFSVEF